VKKDKPQPSQNRSTSFSDVSGFAIKTNVKLILLQFNYLQLSFSLLVNTIKFSATRPCNSRVFSDIKVHMRSGTRNVIIVHPHAIPYSQKSNA
jgi:hypothetical protein